LLIEVFAGGRFVGTDQAGRIMSYVLPAPAPGPVAAPRRPVTVLLAAALLAVMALVGLGYAVATLTVTPGVVRRFQAGAGAADPAGVDGYVTALWLGAGVATILAVILVALYAALAIGLSRGSAVARIGTWVVCGLGLAAGCGSAIVVAMQRGGADSAGELPVLLGDAYPAGWIGLNVALSVAQLLGYLLVAVLLGVSPRAYFRSARQPQPAPPYAYQPGRYLAPPVTPTPAPGPDDEYWARPT
jgi:hypothetical protein